jgi:essential nuclear protein 1
VASESPRLLSEVYIVIIMRPSLTQLSRYSSDLTPEQKDALLDVVRATPHAQIGPEIRRELVNSVVRGAPRGDVDVEMA